MKATPKTSEILDCDSARPIRTSRSKLCASTPSFVPAYVDASPSSKLRVHAQPFMPALPSSSELKQSGIKKSEPAPLSDLANELELDFQPRSRAQPSVAISSICNRLVAHIGKMEEEKAAVATARVSRDDRRGRAAATAAAATTSSATKRPAAKRAHLPSKKQRRAASSNDASSNASNAHGTSAVVDGVALCAGLPLTRSGVSNLFDDLDLQPLVTV